MKLNFKWIYFVAGIAIILFYSYSAWYGRAFWETGVTKNTEYKGGRIYRGYGTGFHHK